MWIVVAVGAIVVFGLILSLGTWHMLAQRRFTQAKPGDLWLHDPTGGLVEEDPEFKKPRDEGGLL
jgi:hypothetical protein